MRGRLGGDDEPAYAARMMQPAARPADPSMLLLLGIATISLGALSIALLGQYAGGIQPCQLCLYARIPYIITGALSLAGLALRAAPRWQRRLAVACAVVFAAGTALAIFQIGVEEHWWRGPASCHGEIPGAGAVSALVEGKDKVRLRPCDQDVWRLFGLSLAGWNAIASTLLAAATLAAATMLGKGGSR